MKIMIDAGHGPNTRGKRSIDGYKEYTFTKAVADMLQDLLLEYKDVTVYRSDDPTYDVSLQERVNQANTKKVDVFVSIHGNAYGNGEEWTDPSGIETYVYTSKPKAAMELGAYVQNELIRETARKNRGLKTDDFYVLRYTNMTAILCELGFYTNKEEKALMVTQAYQLKCAVAILNGLVKMYKLVKNRKEEPRVTYEVTADDPERVKDLIEELADRGFWVRLVD
jgi:N-acetylmuramoyl-L-alanine amidase